MFRKVIFHIPTITTKVLQAQAWFSPFFSSSWGRIWALVMLKLCLFSTDLSLLMLIKRMLIKKKRVDGVYRVRVYIIQLPFGCFTRIAWSTHILSSAQYLKMQKKWKVTDFFAKIASSFKRLCFLLKISFFLKLSFFLKNLLAFMEIAA